MSVSELSAFVTMSESELSAMSESELSAMRESELSAMRESELSAMRESELLAMSEFELSAFVPLTSESELIARDTNPFMEAWKRACNSHRMQLAMDEDVLPSSDDELEEELDAIQPFKNPLDYKQRPAAGRTCRWFGKRSMCLNPGECRKCSFRRREMQAKRKREREGIRRKLLHVDFACVSRYQQ